MFTIPRLVRSGLAHRSIEIIQRNPASDIAPVLTSPFKLQFPAARIGNLKDVILSDPFSDISRRLVSDAKGVDSDNLAFFDILAAARQATQLDVWMHPVPEQVLPQDFFRPCSFEHKCHRKYLLEEGATVFRVIRRAIHVIQQEMGKLLHKSPSEIWVEAHQEIFGTSDPLELREKFPFRIVRDIRLGTLGILQQISNVRTICSELDISVSNSVDPNSNLKVPSEIYSLRGGEILEKFFNISSGTFSHDAYIEVSPFAVNIYLREPDFLRLIEENKLKLKEVLGLNLRSKRFDAAVNLVRIELNSVSDVTRLEETRSHELAHSLFFSAVKCGNFQQTSVPRDLPKKGEPISNEVLFESARDSSNRSLAVASGIWKEELVAYNLEGSDKEIPYPTQLGGEAFIKQFQDLFSKAYKVFNTIDRCCFIDSCREHFRFGIERLAISTFQVLESMPSGDSLENFPYLVSFGKSGRVLSANMNINPVERLDWTRCKQQLILLQSAVNKLEAFLNRLDKNGEGYNISDLQVKRDADSLRNIVEAYGQRDKDIRGILLEFLDIRTLRDYALLVSSKERQDIAFANLDFLRAKKIEPLISIACNAQFLPYLLERRARCLEAKIKNWVENYETSIDLIILASKPGSLKHHHQALQSYLRSRSDCWKIDTSNNSRKLSRTGLVLSYLIYGWKNGVVASS